MSKFEKQEYLGEYPFVEPAEDPGYLEPGDTWLDCVNEGWKVLFLTLCKNIKERCEHHKYDIKHFAFDQVKEKFGALRIYWHLEGNYPVRLYGEINDLVDEAERRSQRMCHICGESAVWGSRGWVLPYCDIHAHEYNDKANERHKTAVSFESAFYELK